MSGILFKTVGCPQYILFEIKRFPMHSVSWSLFCCWCLGNFGQNQSSVGLLPCQVGEGTEVGSAQGSSQSWSKAAEALSRLRSLQGRKWWEEDAEPRTSSAQVPKSCPHSPLQSRFGLPDSPSWHSAHCLAFPHS